MDLSPAMLRVARLLHPTEGFLCADIETWGRSQSYDVATLFFVLHEMPQPARRAALRNALRVSRRRVVVCDISVGKVPSDLMLSGEPYLLNYQRNIVDDVHSVASEHAHVRVQLIEVVRDHVMVCVLEHDPGLGSESGPAQVADADPALEGNAAMATSRWDDAAAATSTAPTSRRDRSSD